MISPIYYAHLLGVSAVRQDNPVLRGHDGRGVKQYLIMPLNLESSTKEFQAREA